MIDLLGVFLLSSTSVSDDASIFVGEPHEHAWTDIYQTDERQIQFDANYSSDGEVNEQTYPVALVRVTEWRPKRADSPIRIGVSQHARVAIDCENSAFTPIEAEVWNRDSEREIVKFPEPQFVCLRPENKELLGPLYRHVCGPNWTLEGNQ